MDKKVKKEDLRVKKTIYSIKETFIELVEQNGFKNVTVSQITKKANINRNTFYLHYTDIEDLANKIISDVSFELLDNLKKFSYISKMTLNEITEIEMRWGFRSILNFLEKDMELYRIYLIDERLKNYIDSLFSMIKRYLALMLNIRNPRSNVVFEYAFSGMVGIFNQWILYSTASINDIAKTLAKLTYSALQQL